MNYNDENNSKCDNNKKTIITMMMIKMRTIIRMLL